jgi:hypothetical protein
MSQVKPIPHNLRSSADVSTTSDPELMGVKINMWVDPQGVLRRRPGVKHKHTVTQTNTLNELTGLFRSVATDYIIAGVGNSSTELRTHRIKYSSSDGFTNQLESTTGFITVAGGIEINQTRFIYSSEINEYLVVHPSTRQILIHNNSTGVDTAHTPASLLSTEDIVSATYVDGYLLLSLVTTGTGLYSNKVIFSDINNFTSWPSSNFINSSFQGDKVFNLASGASEFYIFNSNSIETWQNDGTPFTRRTGGALPYGTVQRLAEPAKVDNLLYFVDSEGRIMAFNGVQTRQIAPQASLFLQKYAYSGFLGRHNMSGFFFDAKPYLHIANSDENIIIDLTTEDYSVFSGENEFQSDVRNIETWSRRVIKTADMGTGLVTIGNIYARGYEYGYYQDTAVNSDTTQDMFAGFWTGWISHGTEATKRSEELWVTLYRDTDETEPIVQVRFRDDGDMTWSSPRTLELAQFSGAMNVFKLHNNGMYKHRQWCIYTTSNAEFKVGKVTEKFQVLGR